MEALKKRSIENNSLVLLKRLWDPLSEAWVWAALDRAAGELRVIGEATATSRAAPHVIWEGSLWGVSMLLEGPPSPFSSKALSRADLKKKKAS